MRLPYNFVLYNILNMNILLDYLFSCNFLGIWISTLCDLQDIQLHIILFCDNLFLHIIAYGQVVVSRTCSDVIACFYRRVPTDQPGPPTSDPWWLLWLWRRLLWSHDQSCYGLSPKLPPECRWDRLSFKHTPKFKLQTQIVIYFRFHPCKITAPHISIHFWEPKGADGCGFQVGFFSSAKAYLSFYVRIGLSFIHFFFLLNIINPFLI